MRRTVPVLLFVLFMVSTGAVWAQTPDGQTPSEETVCDALSGALFGLCNAYCEAMDCDTGPNASQTACDRVLANFRKKSGGADPPCLAPDCCTPPGTGEPGCGEVACESLVCALDDFCCTFEWDSFCVDTANQICPVCTSGGGGGPA